jgi:hypothetical protein
MLKKNQTHFFFFSRKTKDSVVAFLSKTFSSSNTVNPIWLSCLPLVDCLEGSLQPFAPLDLSHFEIIHTKNAEWWCHKDLERLKEEMKKKQWTE